MHNRYLLFALVLLFVGAFLFGVGSEPCAADNSTSVNATLISPDLKKISEVLEEWNNNVEVAMDEFNTTFEEAVGWSSNIWEIGLLFFLAVLSFWRKNNVFLFSMTAIIAIVTGIDWMDRSLIIGVCVFVFGVYMVIEAVMSAFFRKWNITEGKR